MARFDGQASRFQLVVLECCSFRAEHSGMGAYENGSLVEASGATLTETRRAAVYHCVFGKALGQGKSGERAYNDATPLAPVMQRVSRGGCARDAGDVRCLGEASERGVG